MSKCVWYVSKYFVPPGQGSVGGRGYLLMRELARAGDRVVAITSDSNHLADLAALTQPYLRQSMDGIDVWWVRTFKYDAAKSIGRIISWLHFEWRLWRMPKESLPRPDVVVVSSLSLLTILNGLLLRRRYRCRLVLEVRDIWPLTLVEVGGYSRWNPVVMGLAFLERLGYRSADAIIGTMPNLGEHVRKVLGYERRVECVPMGVDESDSENALPLPPGYAAQYLPEGKFVVGYAGTIGMSNALDTFFECAVRLAKHPRMQFLLVGDGYLKAEYQRRYGHLSNLTFGAKLKKEMVQSVLERCDVLYFSTENSERWRYGQSLNKLIDYMYSGKPIVASYSGFPSMVNEAACGRFVPAEDVEALAAELLRLSELDTASLIAMGHRGRQWLLANRGYALLARHMRTVLFPA